MEPLINAFLAIGLLVVIILVVYLVDRVNSLEKETRRMAQVSVAPTPVAADPWAGLSGKALWDAMTGRPPPHLSVATLQELRSNYEVVLQKHIQSLFDEGVRDGRRGLSAEPKNPRTIQTSVGAVESWLPGPQVNSLYKCGLDSTQLPPEALQPVRDALDEAGQQLFAKTEFPQTEPLSASLLPPLASVAAPVSPAQPTPPPASASGAGQGPAPGG